MTRYPSIPHLLAGSGGVTRADKILSPHDLGALLTSPVIVEEKVDGSNLGFSFHDGELRAEHRGAQLSPETDHLYPRLRSWISEREATLDALLSPRLTLFGEWCAARHTIRYDRLPDWLLVFDIYDREANRFLSPADRDDLCAEGDLATVPTIARGRFTLRGLEDLIGQSQLGSELMEGIVVRGAVAHVPARSKLVRPRFLQPDARHWRTGVIELNQLAGARPSPR